MKCSYCGEEICQDENFYIVSDQICCKKCCEENTHTYYTVCDETYEEDVVVPFDTKEEAIAYYKEDIAELEYRITEMSKSNVPWKDDFIKRYKNEIKETQDLLKALEDKD